MILIPSNAIKSCFDGQPVDFSNCALDEIDLSGGGVVDFILTTYFQAQGSVSVDLSCNALTVEQVDGFLAYFAGKFCTGGGSINLTGGTNAAPTGGDTNPSIVAIMAASSTVTHN